MKISTPFLVLALGITIPVVWTLLPTDKFSIDPTDYKSFYDPVATAIVEGHGPTWNGAPAIRYPPGYPFLLAGARIAARPLRVSKDGVNLGLNLASIVISSVFLYRIAALLLGPVPSYMVSALWLTYPLLLVTGRTALTEPPFCALLYAGLFLLFRFVWRGIQVRGQAIVAGLLLGCAMLVRPIGIGVPALSIVTVALASSVGDVRRRLRFIGAMVAGCLFLIIPWETWAFMRTGQWIPLSTGGVFSMIDGLTFAVDHNKAYRAQIPVAAEVADLESTVLRESVRLHSATEIAALLRQEWRHNPRAVANLVVTKAARSWYGTDSGRLDRYIFAVQGIYLFAAVAGGALAASDRRIRWKLVPVVVLIGYFWVMTTVVLSIVRYMLPAMGLVFILVAAGVETLVQKHIRGRQAISADVGLSEPTQAYR